MTTTHACMWTHVLGPALKKKPFIILKKRKFEISVSKYIFVNFINLPCYLFVFADPIL